MIRTVYTPIKLAMLQHFYANVKFQLGFFSNAFFVFVRLGKHGQFAQKNCTGQLVTIYELVASRAQF